MNKTPNYNLSQWAKSDRVLMDDFNADNAKIDAALAEMAAAALKIHVGQYIGTGTWGAGSPNVLTFPFPPKLVIVSLNSTDAMNAGSVFIRGQTACSHMGSVTSSGGYQRLCLTWQDNTLSWYTLSSRAEYQLNDSDKTYFYLAIG